MTRMFAYGALSVTMFAYLTSLGYDEDEIGRLFAAILCGDLVMTLLLTTRADAFGRKRTLLIGAMLQLFSAICFGMINKNIYVLFVAGTIGVITVTGSEIGPFLAVEQAALAQVIADRARMTTLFGYFSFAANLSAALGALAGGGLISLLQMGIVVDEEHKTSSELILSYQAPVFLFAALSIIKFGCYCGLSHAVEAHHVTSPSSPPPTTTATPSRRVWYHFGLHRHASRVIVAKLSVLFSLDSFAGGFASQSAIAFWFHLRYGVSPATIGAVLLGCNVLAGVSSLVSTRLVQRFGAIKTMVYSHLPSNILLILVPLSPHVSLAIALLLIRFSISQMDVPARETYVALVVDADERSAAGGVTRVARSAGLAISPLLLGGFLQSSNVVVYSAPFFVAGGLKIAYDIILYVMFVTSRREQAVVVKDVEKQGGEEKEEEEMEEMEADEDDGGRLLDDDRVAKASSKG